MIGPENQVLTKYLLFRSPNRIVSEMIAAVETDQDQHIPNITTANAAEIGSKSLKKRVFLSRANLLNHAIEVEELTISALRGLGKLGDDPEQSELARAHATAVTNLVRAWDAGMERIRILRGEPMPGSRRPAPDKERVQKRKLNRPPKPKQMPAQEPLPQPAPVISKTEPGPVADPDLASK